MIGNILKVIAALIKGCLVGVLWGSTVGILLGLPLGFFFREIVSSNQDVPLRILLSIILGGLLGFSEVQIFNKKLFATDEHPLIGILVGAVFGLIFGGFHSIRVVPIPLSYNQDYYAYALEYSGALGVRIGAIMYSFFGIAGAVLEIAKSHQPVISKSCLLISLPLLVTSTITCTFVIRGEVPKAYRVCRNEMLSLEGYGVWVHQLTDINIGPNSVFPKLGLVFSFSDGTNDASCSAYRDLSGWHKNGDIWQTLVGCLNCPEGKFGVSP